MAQDENTALIAAVISLFIPGIGHIYGGEQQRGLIWFIGTAVYYVIGFVGTFFLFGIVLLFAAPLVHIGSAADAYLQFN